MTPKKDRDTSAVLGPDTVFRGVYQHALDDKGRVSFPAEFREVLAKAGEDRLVLTNFLSDGARCLEGYTLSSWKRFEEKLRQRSRFDPQVRKLENFYLSRSQVVELDASGRVNIPPHLRTYAGLEREVVFSSSVHGFRVWDKRVWDLVFQEAEGALLENPALFLDVDL